MTGALTLAFRLGTEAVRGCNGLRNATAALRTAARCGRGLRSAGARFPGSVAGDDLLGLMGAQFRELQKETANAAGEWAVRERAREFARAGAGGNESRPWEHATAVASQVRAHAAAGKTEPALTRFPAMPDRPDRTSHAAGADHFQTANTSPDWPFESAADRAATPWPGGTPRNNQPRLPKPTTLSKILERYWEIDRRMGSKSPAAGIPADAPRRSRPLPPVEPPSGAQPSRDRQRDVRQAEFAKRLEAFMSRSPQIAGDRRRFAAQPALPGAPPALYQDPSPHLADVELAGDFAERLADTLREQAIQHGIDIT